MNITDIRFKEAIKSNICLCVCVIFVCRSLSDNFRTLRLNAPSQPLHSGTSGSIATSMRTDAPDYPGSSKFLGESQSSKVSDRHKLFATRKFLSHG